MGPDASACLATPESAFIMTIHQKLLIAAVVAVSAIVPAAQSNAQGLSISIGDRGYYNHGNSYYYRGNQMFWVPGHWGPRHRWIHGHYAQRDRHWRGRGWRPHRDIHIGR